MRRIMRVECAVFRVFTADGQNRRVGGPRGSLAGREDLAAAPEAERAVVVEP